MILIVGEKAIAMGTRPTVEEEPAAEVQMSETETKDQKKKKANRPKNNKTEDVEVIAPSVQPVAKATKRFAKMEQEKIEAKLSTVQARLENAKSKFVRFKREELALHAAIRLKTGCGDETSTQPKHVSEKKVHFVSLSQCPAMVVLQ